MRPQRVLVEPEPVHIVVVAPAIVVTDASAAADGLHNDTHEIGWQAWPIKLWPI